MKQIRRNVFETNSSSTHSICISKKPVTIGKHLYFGIGEYDWSHDCVDIVDYLYTAILEQDDSVELLEKLKSILDTYSISYEFKEPEYSYSDDGKWRCLENGHIDHYDETREFIEAVLADEDLLMRCLFGNSCVYTGNDNDAEPYSMCYAAEPTVWDDNYKSVPNSNHDAANYDYFFKGN